MEIRNLMSIGGTVPVVAQYAGEAERNHAAYVSFSLGYSLWIKYIFRLSETLSEVEAKYDILTSNRSKRLVLDLFGGHREREQRTIAKVIKSQANHEAKAINVRVRGLRPSLYTQYFHYKDQNEVESKDITYQFVSRGEVPTRKCPRERVLFDERASHLIPSQRITQNLYTL